MEEEVDCDAPPFSSLLSSVSAFAGGDKDRARFGGGGDDSPDGDAGRRVAIFDDVLVVLDLLVLVYFLFFLSVYFSPGLFLNVKMNLKLPTLSLLASGGL